MRDRLSLLCDRLSTADQLRMRMRHPLLSPLLRVFSARIAPLILVACIGFLSAPPAQADQASSPNDAETLAELQREIAILKETHALRHEAQEQRLEAQKELQAKDLQLLQSRIDEQNLRIGDINSATNQFAIILTVFAILITLAGAAAWFSASAKAKETVQDWIKHHESDLLKEVKGKLDALAAKIGAGEANAEQASQHIQAQLGAIEAKVASVSERAAQADQHIQLQAETVTHAAAEAKAQLQAALASATPASPTSDQKIAIAAEEQRLKQKPESHYTFSDWESRALAAYADGNLDLAAGFFQEAAKAESATLPEIGRSLNNRAVMLAQRGHFEEAITGFEEVVSRVGDATETSLREQVAKALFNKGVALNRLGKHQEAISCSEEVISRVGDAKETSLREQVAKALVNKGAALNLLGKHQEAISCFEEVISRVGDAKETSRREQVANALNGAGFALLLIAKKSWLDSDVRTQALSDAEERLSRAKENGSSNGVISGNLAYVYFLSGRRELVGDMLQQALKLGGEHLYRETLKDIETTPVPEDAEFRKLVEETWAEIQARKV